MTSRLTTVFVILLGIAAAIPAQAAPVASVGAPDHFSSGNMPLVPVHGCHRNAQDGIEGWHRHVGSYCRPVASGPAERNPYARCRTRCQYVGPIKQCRRVCD